MQVARRSELLAVVPHFCLGNPPAPDLISAQAVHGVQSAQAVQSALGLQHFELPVRTTPFNVAATWHPRLDQDPAHRWLRNEVLEVCRSACP
jgi:DNA-binding transcriptional LysR family regulator